MATQILSGLARADVGRWLPALSAVFLGFSLVLAVGFVRIDAVHDATHDLRHSAAFPCH